MCTILLLGASFSKVHRPSAQQLEAPLQGQVVSSPQQLNGWYRIEVEINAAKNTSWTAKHQSCLFYIKDDLLPPKLNDEIVLFKPPELLDSPRNPGEFNFKHYWYNKSITGQAFLKDSTDYAIVEKGTSLLEDVRQYIKTKINQDIKDSQSAALVTTLFTGDKSLLDYDTKKSFAATGSVHILAVSGLHLGVIFLFATVIFGPLKRLRFGHVLYLTLILTIIWGYALLTGLPASIFRAALMFSVFTVAGVFHLRSTTINNTFMAAFIILLIDTKALFDPGFLFSFSAVLGIVILYRPLYRKITFKNKLLDYFWLMTCISLAAQITTFPLVIFYFHQFPVYFLISNFFLIPLAGIMLYTGVVWLTLGVIPFLGVILGLVLNFLGQCIIFIVDTIQGFPGSLITSMRLNPSELLLIYLIITCLCAAFMLRKGQYLTWSLPLVILFFISKTHGFVQEYQQKKLAIYHLPYHTGVEWINGKSSLLIKDDWKTRGQKIEKFTMQPAQLYFGITDRKQVPIDRLPSFHGLKLLFTNQFTLAIADDKTMLPPLDISPQIDFLLIRNNTKPESIIKHFKADKVIIDGSAYIGKNNEYHYTHHGAFITPL